MSEIKEHKILSDVRIAIGLNPDEVDEKFNSSIISAINTSIAELAQLGLKELGEFTVQTGNETWADFIGEDYLYILSFTRNYIELNSRMLFDPPQSGALNSTLEEQIRKAIFNMQTAIELHELKEDN